MNTQMGTEAIYFVVGSVLWAVLLWPEAARAQRLAEAFARTRHPLVAISLLGTVVRGVGITILLIGAMLAVASRGPTVSGEAIRLVAIGGTAVIAGWAMRFVVWILWKRSGAEI